MKRRSRQAEYQTAGESYANAARKSEDAAKILSAGTDVIVTDTAAGTASGATRSASTGSLRAHRFPSPRTRYGSQTAHEGSTMVILSPTSHPTSSSTNSVARRHSLQGSGSAAAVALAVSPTAAAAATNSPILALPPTTNAATAVIMPGGNVAASGEGVGSLAVSPTSATRSTRRLPRGAESVTPASTLSSSPVGYGSPIGYEVDPSHPHSTDSVSEQAYSVGSPVGHYAPSLSHGPGSSVSIGEHHGVTVIYPRMGEQRRQGVEEQYEATSEANMDLAEVPVEGYYAQNLDVLIPNDLPRSTLLYVLTASDGRDLMFKLIQYTLQLAICFLKTPALFSPEALAFTEPWAERFYRNYNTIRHGRSLFKMGRGLLNVFTLQTVCERLGLRYRESIAHVVRLLLRPWLVAFGLPLLQLGKSVGLTSPQTLQAITDYTQTSTTKADNNTNNSSPATSPTTMTNPTTTNAEEGRDKATREWASNTAEKPRDDPLLTEDVYIHVSTVEAERCTPEYQSSLPWLSVQRPRQTRNDTTALETGVNVACTTEGERSREVNLLAKAQPGPQRMLSPLPQASSIASNSMRAHYGDQRRGWEPLSWTSDDPLAQHITTTSMKEQTKSNVKATTAPQETNNSSSPLPAVATATTTMPSRTASSTSNAWAASSSLEPHASPLRPHASSSDLLGCTSDLSFNPSTHDTVPSTFTDGPPQVTFTLPTNADSASAGLLGESRFSEVFVRQPTPTKTTTTNVEGATTLDETRHKDTTNANTMNTLTSQAHTSGRTAKQPTLLLQPLKDQPRRAGSGEEPPEAAHSSSTEDYTNDSFAALGHAMGMGGPQGGSLPTQAATLPAHGSPTQAMLPEASATDVPSASHDITSEQTQTPTVAAAMSNEAVTLPQPIQVHADVLREGGTENSTQEQRVAHQDDDEDDEPCRDANVEVYDDSDVSVLSHVSSTSDLMQHAELIPAAAAEPGRWRKGPLNFNPLLMMLLGVRSAAAGCRRFLRDATLVSTEQFIRVDVIERHRRPLTRQINRLWLVVAVIDLLLNTVRLLHPGWVRYAMARHDLRCVCGCKATEDREDTIVQQGTYFARLKKDLFFPPLNLDYGAPIPSTIAYFEAAEPSRMLPACSRCGFLYKEPGTFPLTTTPQAVNTNSSSAQQVGRNAVSTTTSPVGINAATPTYMMPSSTTTHDKSELPLGAAGRASYVTAADYTYTTPSMPTAAGAVVIVKPSSVHHLLEGTHALALREKDAHGVERVGIMFIPWLLRKIFDYVWLLRNHANFRATVLLEIRYAAELFLAYTYCFTNYETGKADAPLAKILNPYCALAGIVTAAVGLMRVVESAPK